MKSFFISVIKQILAFIIAVFLVVSLFVILIWSLIGAIEKAPVHVSKDSVLVIDLAMDITDAEGEKQFSDHVQDLMQSSSRQTAYLLEVLDAIEFATKDPRIVGIFLKGGASYVHQGSGYPVLHEVRKAIDEFQKSGKLVVAYFTEADVKDYFLGSVAKTIVLNPLGQIQLKGLAVEMAYFGEAFEKYGIGIQVTKSGKYKSAVEPFTSNHMSEFEKEQTMALLSDMWDNVINMISESRNINKDIIKNISDNNALFLANEAKSNNLVDLIEYEDQAFKHFNLVKDNNEDISHHKIGIKKYIRDTENKKLIKKITGVKHKIGIVYVEGDILEGDGSSFNAGSDRLEKRLTEVRDDEDVKAVVLRVNSPGGGAHAAEKILRAVRLLKEKKPVIVSFGSYAASGGYWVSCYGDAIFTDPMTITGSIGVFGLLPNVEKIAKNYGINFEGVSTGPFGAINSFTKPRTAKELGKLQDSTDLLYHEFLVRVAEGRKLEYKDVEGIAEGRVWSGLKAKEIGLADYYGGLKDAIAYAAEVAKLPEGWEVSQYARERGFGYEILRLFQGSSETRVSIKGMFSKYLKYIEREVESFHSFNDPSSIYARMPYSFLIN